MILVGSEKTGRVIKQKKRRLCLYLLDISKQEQQKSFNFQLYNAAYCSLAIEDELNNFFGYECPSIYTLSRWDSFILQKLSQGFSSWIFCEVAVKSNK